MRLIGIGLAALLAVGCQPQEAGAGIACDVPAASFKVFKASAAGDVVISGKGVLSGFMAVDELRHDPKFGPFMSIVAQGPQDLVWTEVVAGVCKDDPQAICTGLSEMAGKGNQTKRRIGAGYRLGEQIPVRIEIVSSSQWQMTLGGESTVVNLSHPVKDLQFKCVGVKGRIELQPEGQAS